MFDFREYFENQAQTNLSEFVRTSNSFRSYNIISWLLLTCLSLVIFLALIARLNERIETNIGYLFLVSCLSLTFYLVLTKSTNLLFRCIYEFNKSRQQFSEFLSIRPLFYYFIATILFVVGPTIFVTVIVFREIVSFDQSLSILSNNNATIYISSIAPTVSAILLGLLAAQVALFTFVANFLIGKYSSRIASILMQQPTIIILEFSTVLWLAIILATQFWGISTHLSSYPVLYFFLAIVLPIGANVILTFLLSIRGFTADEAIKIVSGSLSQKVMHLFPPTISMEKISLLEKFLMMSGLDWRNSSRRNAFELPAKAVAETIDAIDSLVNAASQAIKDDHTEVLIAALNGIAHVMKSYVKARQSYSATSDRIFAHLANLMNMLVDQVKESSNQTLQAYVVNAIGNICKIAVKVGNRGLGGPSRYNPNLIQWISLLEESSFKFVTSDRSTAVTAALNQLKGIVLLCVKNGLDESIEFTLIPAIEKIFSKFVKVQHSWTYFLTNRILSDLIMMWLSSFCISADFEQKYRLEKKFREKFFELLTIRIEHKPTIGFESTSFGSELTTKTSADTFVIQDVFLCFYLYRPKDGHEALDLKEMLEQLLEGLAIATQKAIEVELPLQGMFVQAFYECAYLVVHGLPKSLLIAPRARSSLEEPPYNKEEFVESSINQDELFEKLFEVGEQLLSLMIKKERTLFREEFDSLVWLIGFLLHRSKIEEKLLNNIEKLIEKIVLLMEENLKDRDRKRFLPYLKLIGAWLDHFWPSSLLNARIQKILITFNKDERGNLRGRSFRSHEGVLGYPESHIGGRLHPPPLRSIDITGLFKGSFVLAVKELRSRKILEAYNDKITTAIKENRSK